MTIAFSAIDERRPEVESEKILLAAKKEADRIIAQKIPAAQKAMALMRIEKQGRDSLTVLRRQMAVTRPRVSLSRDLSNEWTAYVGQMDRLEGEVFAPSEMELERYISTAAQRSKIPLDDAGRLNSAVSEVAGDAVKGVRQLRNDVATILTGLSGNIRETTRQSFSAITHAVDDVLAELANVQRSSTDAHEFSALRAKLVRDIDTVYAVERKKLERLRDQLSEVNRIWDNDSYDTTELTEALEEELDELRRRRDADLELAQIGLALNTISHEFDKTVGSLRDGFRRLKAWAEENPELRDLYSNMRISFDHLDEYLTLFTPLDRRVHRSKIDISGKQILQFLENLFGSRLERHAIKLVATKKFLEASLVSFPSSIYPAFVNLVDNSIFWLQRRTKDRTIELDVQGKDFLIRDNGPGISARDRENIFVLNFSRKPGGRGMGLYISRETLAKVGFHLTLDQSSQQEGTIFRISSIPVQGQLGKS